MTGGNTEITDCSSPHTARGYTALSGSCCRSLWGRERRPWPSGADQQSSQSRRSKKKEPGEASAPAGRCPTGQLPGGAIGQSGVKRTRGESG